MEEVVNMTKITTSTNWLEVYNVNCVSFEQECTSTYADGHRVCTEWGEEIRIQVGDNYGNAIFTDKNKANKVVYALLHNRDKIYEHGLDTFKTVRFIKSLLS